MKLHKKLMHREIMMDPFLRQFGEPKSLLKQLKKIDPNITENLYVWLNSSSNYRFNRWWGRKRKDGQKPLPIQFDQLPGYMDNTFGKLDRKNEVNNEEKYINIIIPSDLLNIKSEIKYNEYKQLKNICTNQFDVKVEVELSCTYYNKLKNFAKKRNLDIHSECERNSAIDCPCLNEEVMVNNKTITILQNNLDGTYKVQYQKGDIQDVERKKITFQYVKIPMTLYSQLRQIYIK